MVKSRVIQHDNMLDLEYECNHSAIFSDTQRLDGSHTHSANMYGRVNGDLDSIIRCINDFACIIVVAPLGLDVRLIENVVVATTGHTLQLIRDTPLAQLQLQSTYRQQDLCVSEVHQ